jgi:hypothetical protein
MRLAIWQEKKYAQSKPVVSLHPSATGLPYGTLPLPACTYNQDSLATAHSIKFTSEPDFATAYEAAFETGSWGGSHIQWRAHVICWTAHVASHFVGDFVECGTNRGGTAMLVLRYLGDALKSRRLFLFDTFRGLDERTSTTDEISRLGGHYTECYDHVQKLLEPWPIVQIIRGLVPETLHSHAPERIAWLHIDLNAAEPERAALEFLWPRLAPGAPVVLDDYAWTACNRQKEALDAFAASVHVRILSLPTGQGLLFKPL